jgi:hypothetical protein
MRYHYDGSDRFTDEPVYSEEVPGKGTLEVYEIGRYRAGGGNGWGFGGYRVIYPSGDVYDAPSFAALPDVIRERMEAAGV